MKANLYIYIYTLVWITGVVSTGCDTDDESKKVDKTLFHCTLSEEGFWEALYKRHIGSTLNGSEILAAQEQSDPEGKYCHVLSAFPGNIDSLINLCSFHNNLGSSSDYGPCKINHRYKCVYYESEQFAEYFTASANRELLQRYCEGEGAVWTEVE